MTTPRSPAISLANILARAVASNAELPFWRLARLALFQVSCGMVAVMLTGTLNRVMIVELHMPGWLVALMVSMPLIAAPFRALIGFKSDTHFSVFGWRRLPYVWFGSLLQFGGLAIMPFALLILSGTGVGPMWPGYVGAALGFLLIGAGMHTVQTVGLALATDLATDENRARVIAFHYVMLLVGMMISGFVISALLTDFTAKRLIQVIQGAAIFSLLLNVFAMWGQETRARPGHSALARSDGGDRFGAAWRAFLGGGRSRRLLVAVSLGSAAFNMGDVVIEPFGGQVLGLQVGATTMLTAIWAAGTLVGFVLASRMLDRVGDCHRVAAAGLVFGIPAFVMVMLSAPMQSTNLFGFGALLIGFGGGFFSVGTLAAVMRLAQPGFSGLAIGAWGAVQAMAAGLSIAFAGILRDVIAIRVLDGAFGPAVSGPASGYLCVFAIEIALLLATLVAIGPLAQFDGSQSDTPSHGQPGAFGDPQDSAMRPQLGSTTLGEA